MEFKYVETAGLILDDRIAVDIVKIPGLTALQDKPEHHHPYRHNPDNRARFVHAADV